MNDYSYESQNLLLPADLLAVYNIYSLGGLGYPTTLQIEEDTFCFCPFTSYVSNAGNVLVIRILMTILSINTFWVDTISSV